MTTETTTLDHQAIADQNLVERYYRGALPPELEARFEEHFLDCAACQEQLAVEQGLRGGARQLAVEESARTVVSAGILAWLARRRLVPALLLLALMAGATPLVWTLYQRKEQAEGESIAWQQRAERAEQESQQLAADLRRLREQRIEPPVTAPPPAPAASGAPSAPLTPDLFLLQTVRGENDLPQIPTGAPATLAVYIDPDLRFTGYRMSLGPREGDPLWQQGGLQPNDLGALLVTLPAEFLPPGEYRLRLEGELQGGGEEEVETYRFRVFR